LRNEDLAYLAAIIDGEGSIVLWLEKVTGRHICRIVITNTDNGILDECKRILNSLGIFWCCCTRKTKTVGKIPKDVSQIEVNRKNEVLELIKLIKPFLHSEVKLEKCRQLDEYLSNHNFDSLGRKLNHRKKFEPEEVMAYSNL
jgi:hypothetical protein